jgi:ribosomal protein S18 acetylase RimI-like enzyme
MTSDRERLATLRCRRLGPEWVAPLGRFLEALHDAGEDAHFHPHPTDTAKLEALARDSGQDLYYVVADDRDAVLAYGMLRGWADHDVPSLGIAVHPASRGRGLGRMLMSFLHDEARRHGASHVRLRVYPDNHAARRLYEQLGYDFGQGEEDGQLVALIEL